MAGRMCIDCRESVSGHLLWAAWARKATGSLRSGVASRNPTIIGGVDCVIAAPLGGVGVSSASIPESCATASGMRGIKEVRVWLMVIFIRIVILKNTWYIRNTSN